MRESIRIPIRMVQTKAVLFWRVLQVKYNDIFAIDACLCSKREWGKGEPRLRLHMYIDFKVEYLHDNGYKRSNHG
jgi:hypothetical protein